MKAMTPATTVARACRPWMSPARLSRPYGPRLPTVRAVDALLVTSLTNIRYLTGFTGSAALLLVLPDERGPGHRRPLRDQSEEQLAAAGVAARTEIGQCARPAGGHRGARGFGGRRPARARGGACHLGCASGRSRPTGSPTPSWCPPRTGRGAASGQGRAARSPGSPSGRRHRRRGPGSRCARCCAEGPTEVAFGLALDSEMRRLGASGNSFETIVASGPNGAKPHHRPSARQVRRRRPGRPRLRRPGRRLLLGHDPHGLRRRAHRRAATHASTWSPPARPRAWPRCGPGWPRRCRPGLPGGHRRGRVGRAFHARHGPRCRPRHPRGPGGRRYVVGYARRRPRRHRRAGRVPARHGGVRIEDTVVVTDDGCRPLTDYSEGHACS